MISVDSSDEERTGESGVYGRAHSARVINLDHHITNTFFGDIFLVMPSAVSATEVVYHWLREWQQPLALDIAVPLLTGLVTDTIGFRTSNVTANTLRVAVELMEAGAPLAEITQRTLSSMSYRVLDLWKHSLTTVQLHNQVIEASVRQADLHAVGLDDMTDGGLVQLLNTISEARIAVVFKEMDELHVEISLRSRPGYDVAQVALGLGGGGHPQASGATVDGTLESVRGRVLPLLQAVTAQNS
jgi:phosphoesterase RecJ-like protein